MTSIDKENITNNFFSYQSYVPPDGFSYLFHKYLFLTNTRRLSQKIDIINFIFANRFTFA